MSTPISGPPQEPASPPVQEIPHHDPVVDGAISTDPKTTLSKSPFAAMFRGGATVEELQQFIDGCLKMVAREIKRAQERWEKSQRRMRQMMEGKLPDEW
ncbi:MAG: hypothetical protein FJZ58_06730 [Chlamydiae bacterium]|nr:hypothetical protein [Chlamydiota bacterium]